MWARLGAVQTHTNGDNEVAQCVNSARPDPLFRSRLRLLREVLLSPSLVRAARKPCCCCCCCDSALLGAVVTCTANLHSHFSSQTPTIAPTTSRSLYILHDFVNRFLWRKNHAKRKFCVPTAMAKCCDRPAFPRRQSFSNSHLHVSWATEFSHDDFRILLGREARLRY